MHKDDIGSSDQMSLDEKQIPQEFYADLQSTYNLRSHCLWFDSFESHALSIIRNLVRCAPHQALNEEGSLCELTKLLSSAVALQMEHKYCDDKLIARSLICLKACAEVLRMQDSGLLDGKWHIFCAYSGCKFECVAGLNSQLSSYARELSKVFFKKENLQHKQGWWLTAFYSLCLQSYVKRVLIALTQPRETSEFYEEALQETGLPVDGVGDVAAKLQLAYAFFQHQHEQYGEPQVVLGGLERYDYKQNRWLRSSTIRRFYLNEVLQHNLDDLNTKLRNIKSAENPYKQPHSRFESALKRSKLSKEQVADFGLVDPVVVKNAEAHQYLHLPVRLFIVLNQASADPIHLKEQMDGLREAVGQAEWHEKGITSSAEYLLHIFEDGRETPQETSMQDEVSNHERLHILGCTVCKTNFRMGSPIATLPCSHWFHETCIVAWLEQINICPSCKKEVYSEDTSALSSTAEMSSTDAHDSPYDLLVDQYVWMK